MTLHHPTLIFLFALLLATPILSKGSGLKPCQESQFFDMVKDYRPYSFTVVTADGYKNRLYSISKEVN